jgi:NADH dehydrogenase
VRKGSESKVVADCEIVYGDIGDKKSIKETIKDTEAIIYNIGIIREFPSKGITYTGLHYEGVRLCIQMAEEMNVKRFILMSANGVKLNGTGYQSSKFQAEQEVQNSNLQWTIFRPSLIFGRPHNPVHQEFCSQLRDEMLSLPFPAPLFYEGILPVNAGSFSMSPIHAKNVSEFFVKSLNMKSTVRKIYNIGGLEDLTWKEIIHRISRASNKLAWKVPVPAILIKFVARIFDRFEWFPVTNDQLTMLMEGNIVNELYFSNFDIEPIEFSAKNLDYLMK